jgi:hypothetical protein
MALDNLTFRTAQKHVQNLGHEKDVMERHREAMEYWDCEAYLQLGIDAFEWIIRADLSVREHEREGRIDAEQAKKCEARIIEFCRGWLSYSTIADKWSSVQKGRGYTLDNLDDFIKCRNELQAIVEANEGTDDALPVALAVLRDHALQDHKNGKTAEFLS